MFNVTVVKLKDIIKYLIAFLLIYAISNFFLKNTNIKNIFNISIMSYSEDLLKLGINTESNIINQYSKKISEIEQTEEIESNDFITIESILKIGTNVFDIKDDVNNNNEQKENIDEQKPQEKDYEISKASLDVKSEVVTKNPITENYNLDYKGVKIKNETSYDITDEVLNPDSLNINSKNIVIFHTHTCESYTQTDNCKYEESRKF